MNQAENKIFRGKLKAVKVNDKMQLNFMGTAANATSRNGEYNVLSNKCSPGRGGTYNFELENVSTKEKMSFSTKQLSEVLNMAINGERIYGYNTEAEFNSNAAATDANSPNKENADVLYAEFEALKALPHVGKYAVVAATKPEFNGTFTIEKITKAQGRPKQLILCLRDKENNGLEIWSYRHSALIQEIEFKDSLEEAQTATETVVE